jgi:hypothetical protein
MEGARLFPGTRIAVLYTEHLSVREPPMDFDQNPPQLYELASQDMGKVVGKLFTVYGRVLAVNATNYKLFGCDVAYARDPCSSPAACTTTPEAIMP